MHQNFTEYLYSKFLQSDGVSIDTRTIEPDNLFFALKGPNFNANQYAEKALELGAAYAVVDDEQYVTDPRIILADDCQQALQELAIFHRSRYKRKLLAITGSNGKTTTKELIHRVLSEKYITHATKGNYNNHLGVPLTLLHIHPQVEAAIIEMGANHVGEIAELCRMANPTHGLITNIGEAHTETFGGIEGVLRGKSELFDHLRKAGGTPFINTADERLSHMTKRFDQPITYPDQNLKLVSANPFLTIRLSGKSINTQLIGTYNFSNIAAAVSVGREFGVADERILEAIANYVPANQRSQVIQQGDLKVIVDCYNANPTSMKAAIDNLKEISGSKAVILGDMLEVANSEEKHREVGRWVIDAEVSRAIFIGEAMKAAHTEVENSEWYESVEKFMEDDDLHLDVATVLIKASRAMKLDLLANQLNKA